MPYEKVGDNEPVCIADEVPFDIPDGWEWCRLSYICSLSNGEKVNNRIMSNLDAKYLRGLKKADKLSSGYLINKNDIMILVDGENSGEIFVSNEMGYQGSTFKRLDISAHTFNKYVIQFIRYNNFLLKKKKIGAAIPHLNKNLFFSLLFPLPPLQEQQRIVTEIEKYLPLINEYDRLQTELDTLDKEFPEKLKKSILQEAIKGKLVEQDPSDEPASVLLEKIRKEKEKLIKECKIKKDKNESIIYKRDNSYYEKLNGVEKCIDDEMPFEIPESWELARFNSIVNYHMGKTPPRKDSKYWENASHNWISIADMVSDGIIKNTKEKVNDYSVKNIFKNQISKKGTLIMSFKLTVGRVSILDIDAFHNEAIISIIPYYDINNIIRDYLFTFLPLISTYGDTKTAIKGNTLNSTSIDNLIIPIPPINEQYRIIKKIILLLAETKKLTNQL